MFDISRGTLYPVLPLRDIVVFPHMIVPLFVGREKSVRALEDVMKDDKQILLVTQKNAAQDDPTTADIFMVGTVGTVAVGTVGEPGPERRLQRRPRGRTGTGQAAGLTAARLGAGFAGTRAGARLIRIGAGWLRVTGLDGLGWLVPASDGHDVRGEPVRHVAGTGPTGHLASSPRDSPSSTGSSNILSN